MDELSTRQAAVLRQLVSDYREGLLGLDSLVQRIEGIGNVLDSERWKDAVFPIVLALEQVNAAVLIAKRRLNEDESAYVEKTLRKLEAVVNHLGALKPTD
jgi:hypothetical protein